MLAATADTAATVRPGQCRACCQAGLGTYAEQPLPEAPGSSFQTCSAQPRLVLAVASSVPPTAVTLARLAGNLAAPNPPSPEDTTITCPVCSSAAAYVISWPSSRAP